VSDLKRLDFSETVEDEPIETLRFRVLPLKNEPTKLSEPLKALEEDTFLVIPEFTAQPALRDLKLEIFSLKLEVEEKKPARDLNMESLSINAEAAETVALIALKSEIR